MGNRQAQQVDQQADSFFSALPEDIIIMLADLITVQDFVRLNTTCKYYYYHLLGPNNILWARVSQFIGGPHKVMKELQFLSRWAANNGQTNLQSDLKEIDLTNKEQIGSIDFKKEIADYYRLIFNDRRLRERITKLQPKLLSLSFPISFKTLPMSWWTNLSQYWTRLDLSKDKSFSRDHFYEVDLYYDPDSIERFALQSGHKITFPLIQGGLLVLYKKSNKIMGLQYDTLDGDRFI